MSKILKGVELGAKPFSLKVPPSETTNKALVNKVGVEKKAYAALSRSLEDDANILIQDALDRSMKIVEEAKAQAEKIIDSAKVKKEQIEEEAYLEGFNAGKTEGYQEGWKKAEAEAAKLKKEQLAKFEELKQKMQDNIQRLMMKLEQECIKIALHVAEKILHTTVELDTKSFLSMIQKALERVGGANQLNIKLGPEDYARIKDCDDLSLLKSEVKTLTVTEDPHLGRGDCILEADHFEVEAGVSAQLANIEEDLREMGVISVE